MEVHIKKISENVSSNICYMPNDIFAVLKLSKEVLYKFHLGQNHEYSYITPKVEHDKCMYFSNSVLKKLRLFEGVKLNIWKNGDEIYLGPVVGVFVNTKVTAAIRVGKPSFFTQKHAEAGSKTNCLAYFYSIEGVNLDEGKIKGYTFVQSLNKWICDWFPMPDVIYDLGAKLDKYGKPYGKYMRQQFRVNNIHFINSQRHLSKWKVHECLSKYPDMSIYLPKTTFYRSFTDVSSMLSEFKFIFVKATNGSQGKQVLSIEKIDKGYKLNFNKHGLKEIIYKKIEDVKVFVEKFTKKRTCIVQQGIKLIKYNGRNMDLRLLMMKDEQGKWEAVEPHCRIAQKTYKITNWSLGGDWISYEKVYPHLRSSFRKRSIPDEEELVNATKKVLYYYEKELGSFGELGMDMAIDIYGHIWFIEANTKPDKLSSPKNYKPKEVPVQAINIFKYAKFLASNVTT